MSAAATPRSANSAPAAGSLAAKPQAMGDHGSARHRSGIRRVVWAVLPLLLSGCVPIGVRVQNMLALWQG